MSGCDGASITFRGRVQGVGFRFTTRRVAQSHAVCGWVRNEPDGSVRCDVTGDRAEIERFLESIEAAMPGHVHDRQITWTTLAAPFDEFEIRM